MIKTLLLVLLVSMTLSGCFPDLGGGGPGKQKGQYLKNELIKGFPPVPYYPESKLIESYGADNKWGASYISNDKLDEVIKFYSESLKLLGWDFSVRQAGTTNFVFDINNTELEGVIIVNTTTDPKKTGITISIGPR